MNKLATVKVQGGDYATVPTRLKAFREANPRASIETTPTIDGDKIMFRTKIVQDKSDLNSPEATGHSYGENKGAKAFEKLETISVGRALALLGYLNNGQIATTEELEEFESFKAEKVQKQIEEATTVDELMLVFQSMDASTKQEFTPLLSAKKKELLDGTTK